MGFRAIVIEDDVGGPQPGCFVYLACYTTPNVRLIQAPVTHEATDADVFISVDDDHKIHAGVQPIVNEEGHVVDDTGLPGGLGLGELAAGFRLDAGVGNGIKQAGGLGGGEGAPGQFGTTQTPIGVEDIAAEGVDKLGECGGAGFDNAAGDSVGVNDGNVMVAQHAGNRGFTGADATGEANFFHKNTIGAPTKTGSGA